MSQDMQGLLRELSTGRFDTNSGILWHDAKRVAGLQRLHTLLAQLQRKLVEINALEALQLECRKLFSHINLVLNYYNGDRRLARAVMLLTPQRINQELDSLAQKCRQLPGAQITALRLSQGAVLNEHQMALCHGALYEDSNAIASKKMISTQQEFDRLLMKFRANPKDTLAYMRNNMFAMAADTSMPQRMNALHAALESYFQLMLLLDKRAFAHDALKVYRGLIDYLPDGFSDMGSNASINADDRNREKIHVDKREIFSKFRTFFIDIFSKQIKNKKSMFEWIGYTVFNQVSYDYANRATGLGSGSIPLSGLYGQKKAVCRHQALYAQVLSQAFGLTCKLLKCNMTCTDQQGRTLTEPHAANLARIDLKWHLYDVTNPVVTGTSTTWLHPIQETDIDLNRKSYRWGVYNGTGMTYYQSRNDAYYRIK